MNGFLINNSLKKSALLILSAIISFASDAQRYTYLPESFEDTEWTVASNEIDSKTGRWSTNKNISTTSTAQDGSASFEFSKKDGIVSPMLNEGAGALIYWAKDTNRQVNVEVSDGDGTWWSVESYKETSDWTKHYVPIFDKNVRYVRITTTSNNQFNIDNILITKPDGTDGNGNIIATDLTLPYFTNDFEHDNFPASKDEAASEKAFVVDGEGEWIYLNAYKSTNQQYIPDGSARALRLLKNGSYVITPVLNQGAKEISFQSGRPGKKLKVYTSSDNGSTWTLAKEFETETDNVIPVNERNVNRVRISNESTNDNDIDNIKVTAFPEGTPASVKTGSVSEISYSSAKVAVEIISEGSGKIIEKGVCWNLTGEPTTDNNKTACKENESEVVITRLPASHTIYCRAYVITLGGVGYGETVTFETTKSTLPKLSSIVMSVNEKLSSEKTIVVNLTAHVSDNGGSPIKGVGFELFTEGPDGFTKNGVINVFPVPEAPADFTCKNELKPETIYKAIAFAETESGKGYSDELIFTTPRIQSKDYPQNTYYCDPEGNDETGDGSKNNPFYSLQLAVDKVVPGDRIVMNAGTYKYSRRIDIPVCGEPGSGMIKLESSGGRAILDFSEMSVLSNNQGIRLTGSYWHFYGIDICNAGDNGLLIEREKKSGENYAEIKDKTEQAHDNLIENCRFYRNADTGFQMKNLASYNRVVNCDSYFNADPDHGDADGFAVKLSHGDGNYFYGCRAWNNSDDGWDQFIKKEGGFPDDITTTLDECWAFRNGYLEDDTKGNGNGNGFKMGSKEGRNNVIMNRCLAFENLNKGFDQNHNTGNMILNNCSGFGSKDDSNSSKYTYRLDEAVAADHEIRLTNCVAISDGISDRKKSAFAPYSVSGTIITSEMNALPEDFKSIDWKPALGERDQNGNLPKIDFMAIRNGNRRLIDAGSYVGPYSGESEYSKGITFFGEAPDLGCFENDGKDSAVESIKEIEKASDRLSIAQAKCGLIILTVKGALPTDTFRIAAFSLNGAMLTDRRFNGGSASLELPGVKGIVILTVEGEGLREAIKIRM